MALAPGTLLGPYEVLAPLGAGGMGEVYRAGDTRLGRDVAVKVLPAGTANDPAAAARFDREARAIAALNHPSIRAGRRSRRIVRRAQMSIVRYSGAGSSHGMLVP